VLVAARDAAYNRRGAAGEPAPLVLARAAFENRRTFERRGVAFIARASKLFSCACK
jgi:hypothetical protein